MLRRAIFLIIGFDVQFIEENKTMLSKLQKLYNILSNKSDETIVQYEVRLIVLGTNPPEAFVEIESLNLDGTKDFYKFGDITEKFNLNTYLKECIEDLSK